jgi:hypothetical protein
MDDYYLDPTVDHGGRKSKATRTYLCKYCKTGGLIWKETPKGFRLFNLEGEQHICSGQSTEYEDKLIY